MTRGEVFQRREHVVCPVFGSEGSILPEVWMARVLDAIISHRVGRLSRVERESFLGSVNAIIGVGRRFRGARGG